MAEAPRFRARWARVSLTLACLVLTLLCAAQSAEKFRLRLTPVSMDAAMKVNIAGMGSGSATLAGNKLNIQATFDGLLSPVTNAQIHRGSATGVRGPAILDLTVSRTESASGENAGSISGAFELTAEQVESLRKGRFYVQIASEKAPDGNLWGWLLP